MFLVIECAQKHCLYHQIPHFFFFFYLVSPLQQSTTLTYNIGCYKLSCGPGLHNQYNDSLWARQFGNWILVGARFSTPFSTGPGAYPASCTIGTGSLSQVLSGWGVALTTHPHLALGAFIACSRVTFTSFTFLQAILRVGWLAGWWHGNYGAWWWLWGCNCTEISSS